MHDDAQDVEIAQFEPSDLEVFLQHQGFTRNVQDGRIVYLLPNPRSHAVRIKVETTIPVPVPIELPGIVHTRVVVSVVYEGVPISIAAGKPRRKHVLEKLHPPETVSLPEDAFALLDSQIAAAADTAETWVRNNLDLLSRIGSDAEDTPS